VTDPLSNRKTDRGIDNRPGWD